MVDKFTYLGSTLSRVVHIDDEVNARITKAGAAFGRLRGSIWDRIEIRLDTKLKVGGEVGKRSMVVRRSDTRTPSKPPLILQQTNRVVGTDCLGSNTVARPHKKGSW